MRRLALLAILTISTIHPQEQAASSGDVLIGIDDDGKPIARISESGKVTIADGHTAQQVILSLVQTIREQGYDDNEQFSACMDGWGRAAIQLQQEIERGRGRDWHGSSSPSVRRIVSLR